MDMSSSSPDHVRATALAEKYSESIKDKVILVTGASPNSLGHKFVETLAAHAPALLVLAGRNPERTQEVADAVTAAHPGVKTKVLVVDLGSLASVRKAADVVNGWDDVPAIDVMVNNSGIMATPYATTSEGFETQLATNHLGPFLLTNLIMEAKIMKAREPRVVMVASDGHQLSPFRHGDPNFDGGKTYNRWMAYGQSKTANMLVAVALANKLGARGLTAASVHPGVIGTNLGGHIDWENSGLPEAHKLIGNPAGWNPAFNFLDPDQGAATHVFAAFDREIARNNGVHCTKARIANVDDDVLKPWAYDAREAEKVWKVTEKLIGQNFSY